MKMYIKSFFDKYLIIGSLVFFIAICFSKYFSDFIGILILLFIFLCVIINIKNNIQLYVGYNKLLYLFLLFIYCFTIFVMSSFIGLMFFTDLSKIWNNKDKKIQDMIKMIKNNLNFNECKKISFLIKKKIIENISIILNFFICIFLVSLSIYFNCMIYKKYSIADGGLFFWIPFLIFGIFYLINFKKINYSIINLYNSLLFIIYLCLYLLLEHESAKQIVNFGLGISLLVYYFIFYILYVSAKSNIYVYIFEKTLSLFIGLIFIFIIFFIIECYLNLIH